MKVVYAVVMAAVLLAGCAQSQSGSTPSSSAPPSATPAAAEPSASEPAPSETEASTSEPSESATSDEPTAADPTDDSSGDPDTKGGRVGDWVKLSAVKVRVIKVKMKDVSSYNDTPDRAALVRTCATDGDVSVDWSSWYALDRKGGQFNTASATYNDYPRPEYPFGGRTLAQGSCTEGWVIFETNKFTKLYGIVYQDDDASEQAAWLI